jgi:hypothetical protein
VRLVLQPRLIRSGSTVDGDSCLPIETTSPGSKSSVWTVIHFVSRRHWIGYGTIDMVLNSLSVLNRWYTTVHSNMMSMNRVNKL